MRAAPTAAHRAKLPHHSFRLIGDETTGRLSSCAVALASSRNIPRAEASAAATRIAPPPVCVVDADAASCAFISQALMSAQIAVSTFDSAEAFLALSGPASAAGCVVSELTLPGLDGVQLQDLTGAWSYPPAFIFVGASPPVAMVVAAVKAGAIDVLVKPLDPVLLLRRVRECLATAGARRAEAQHRAEARSRLARLTLREQDVLNLLLQGRSNKQIAAALGVTSKTVESHRGQVMRKADIANLADLFRLVIASLDSPPRF